MARRILVLEGHPDTAPGHYGTALADAYARAAEQAGHTVERLRLAGLEFPLLRSRQEWESGGTAPDIARAQAAIRACDHLVIVYPLWLGTMPALLKGFLEQVLRPGFAFTQEAPGQMGRKGLKGRSARIVVTMGMPAFFYRWFYRAHSLKSLERNILAFVGIAPVRHSLVGLVEGKQTGRRTAWLRRMEALGRKGI